MEYDNYPAVSYVTNLQVKGSRYGLTRTREMLDALGSPDEKLKIIHVAGTNGKGSICAYITNILLASGKSVGTFTSPKVYTYEEQFLVNGKPDLTLTEKYLGKVIALSDKMQDKPTAFETETCAALLMFCGEGCEYAVIECGLGGLTDSTNAINKKRVAVISSVSLEHTALLGNTVTEIAKQKAGIIKNCPAVINPLQSPEVLRYFRDIGGVIADMPEFLEDGINGCKFILAGEEYLLEMHGIQQAYNAATAVKVCEGLGIDKAAIKAGLKNTMLFGRVEVINSSKTYILDGDIMVVTPESYRAKPSEEVYLQSKKYFAHTYLKQRVLSALESAAGDVVIVCGSFTLLKEAKQWIGKRQ